MINYTNLEKAQPADVGVRNIPAGGYVAQILMAHMTQTKAGEPMLELYLDIVGGPYADFFARRKSQDGRWPNAGIYRQSLPVDQNAAPDDFRLRKLKGILDAVKASDPYFEWNGDEARLVGCRIGIVYRDEEFVSKVDGRIAIASRPDYVCSVQDIQNRNYYVPEVKRLRENTESYSYRMARTPEPYPAEQAAPEFKPVEGDLEHNKDLPF